MKNLSNFEAFKLNKNQMNAIVGGAPAIYEYSCICHSTGEKRPLYIEDISQLEEARDLCKGDATCTFVGVE